MSKRVNIKAILSDPDTRKELLIGAIIAIQAREGITTTYEQAESAYRKANEQKLQRNFSKNV